MAEGKELYNLIYVEGSRMLNSVFGRKMDQLLRRWYL